MRLWTYVYSLSACAVLGHVQAASGEPWPPGIGRPIPIDIDDPCNLENSGKSSFVPEEAVSEPLNASPSIERLQISNPEPGIAPLYALRPEPPDHFGKIFLRTWVPVTTAEFVLLGVTATLPKSWTGWSAHFVRDGINHLERAYTRPPVWDDDWWVHNYVGHPYGGSLYYNSVRSQGATPAQSMLFSAVLSTQWEYFFEAFAERPSIQDLIVTPVAGSIIGELTHQLTLNLEKGGTSTGEKIIIFVTNPMHVVFDGF
jgi:uncharacterized protein DUF3943